MDAPKHQLADLFEANQRIPISRDRILVEAPQLDSLNRLRRNGGARDILDVKGIALLSGARDKFLIEAFGLGPVGKNEFISYTPANQAELNLLRHHGHSKLQSPSFP